MNNFYKIDVMRKLHNRTTGTSCAGHGDGGWLVSSVAQQGKRIQVDQEFNFGWWVN